MLSTPSPIRLAFVAMLAAFALGACSGGGGITPGDRSDFFPVEAGQVTWGAIDSEGNSTEVTAGTTLSNILDEGFSSLNFPQFSGFQFGAAENANGIPLQKDFKTSAGRYAAVAYQAVLEHSMLLVQGGVYRFPIGGDNPQPAAPRPGGFHLSTGVPTTGSPIAGTWKGKAVGYEWRTDYAPASAISQAEAERRIVQADVEIGVTLDGGDQNVTWAFKDWDGGSIEHPDLTSGDLALLLGEGGHAFIFSGSVGEARDTYAGVQVQFYGPGRQEAGGSFEFETQVYTLEGAFAAKKQDE